MTCHFRGRRQRRQLRPIGASEPKRGSEFLRLAGVPVRQRACELQIEALSEWDSFANGTRGSASDHKLKMQKVRCGKPSEWSYDPARTKGMVGVWLPPSASMVTANIFGHAS